MKHAILFSVGFIFLFAATITIGVYSHYRSSKSAAHREVAITFDDLPVVSARPDIAAHQEITTKLLKSLTSNKVPAVGFVNEDKLLNRGEREAQRVALLRQWLDAGFELGNHTFSHIDLHTTPLSAFEEDVVRGEMVTKALLSEKNMQLRYFRHPYLHTGRDLETKLALESFLARRGYRVAPVTIENSDWTFANAYDQAVERGDKPMMQRIAQEFISSMEREFESYERQSVDLFGHEIKHVLLLHANALNADHFDALARMMKRRGYSFITLEQALTDKAYQSPDTYTGDGGITWLHCWAITKGMEPGSFRSKPTVPDFVMKEARLTPK